MKAIEAFGFGEYVRPDAPLRAGEVSTALLACMARLTAGNIIADWQVQIDAISRLCRPGVDAQTNTSVTRIQEYCEATEGRLESLQPWQLDFALQLIEKQWCSKIFFYDESRVIVVLKAYDPETQYACIDFYVHYLELENQPYFTLDVRGVDRGIRSSLPEGFVGLYFR